jgi:phosphohistidine phosphatase SixA
MNTISQLRVALLTVILTSIGIFHAVQTFANDAVWAKLAEGGKVVLMRHGSVNQGPGNGNSLLRDTSCRQERNLSSEGEREARMVGEQFRARKIPIAEVRNSPFCRTSDTARLAFGKSVPVDYLSLREILGPEEATAQSAQLSQVIGSYTGKRNLILVTHEPNISAVSFETMKHADFLVLQPKGGDQFEELGMVSFDTLK